PRTRPRPRSGPARPGGPRGPAMSRRGGRRTGRGPRTPADGSGWDRPLRSREDRGPPGWHEAGDDRGGEGDDQGEPDRPQRRREDHEIREAEEGSERDDGVGHHDPQ